MKIYPSCGNFLLRLLLTLLVVVSGTHTTRSQDQIGQHEVKVFTRSEYAAGSQNWTILQDSYNRIYIANNEGLLVYNGTNWQVYPVPNNTILRSIAFGREGKLYAGAQDELGYYYPDKSGQLYYHSLKNLLPAAEMNFSDVWDLEVAGDTVFFRTTKKIFVFTGGKFTVYPASSAWLSLAKHQGSIIAQEQEAGLLVYQKGQWQPLVGKQSLPADFIMTALAAYRSDTSLLGTFRNGLFLLTQDTLVPFRLQSPGFNSSQHITALSVLDDKSIIIGTYFNGIYHISNEGKELENISVRNGLPNNTVRCVFADKSGKLWMGLDNGTAYFSLYSAIKHINPPAFNNGAGYGVKVVEGELFVALSTGLKWLPVTTLTDLSANTGIPKPVLDGLTWNLSLIDNQLLAGRDDGLYKIRGHTATPLSQATGFWNCQPISGTQPLQFAAGNYLGIRLFETSNGVFTDKGTIADFSASSRYVETDDKNIWVSHPYRGVYKINSTNRSVTLFSQKDGLPADLENHVFKIKNKIVFGTKKGIYTYNAASNRMEPAKEFIPLFGELPIRYLKEDAKGNIWFVQDKMVGLADLSTDKPQLHYFPELKNKIISGFENIYPFNLSNVWVGGETGFYQINYEKYKASLQPFTVYLTRVRTSGAHDSLLYGGFGADMFQTKNRISIPFKQNSLHFSYASTLYGQFGGVEFCCYLEGFDKNWSPWSFMAEKDYTNLPAGSYTFHVKARNSPSHESEDFSYLFTIRPPWYQTWWAYLLYAATGLALLIALLKFQAANHRRKQEARRLSDQQLHEEQQNKLLYRHQLDMERSEKELIRLKNEKLEAEIAHKNTELASATMNLVQKKEFILRLKSELQLLQNSMPVKQDADELKKMLKILTEEEKLNEEWENFARHFNAVHSNFLILLKQKYPDLKPHEMKLCAYLRMQLSSKEIAQLMSISVRGVEISRYRLRKKLGLPTETNLTQFLFDMEK